MDLFPIDPAEPPKGPSPKYGQFELTTEWIESLELGTDLKEPN